MTSQKKTKKEPNKFYIISATRNDNYSQTHGFGKAILQGLSKSRL